MPPPKMMLEIPAPAVTPAGLEQPAVPAVTAADIASFKEMLKGSLAMDIST